MPELELDDKRREILKAQGHLIIEGGPGCGKTTIALLKALEHIDLLEPEQKILFLSFSRAAVRQVTDRMAGLLTRAARQTIEVRTFHSFFLDLLRSHGRLLTGKPVSFITPEREAQRRAEYEGDWPTEVARLALEDSVFVFDSLAPFAADLVESSTEVRDLYSSRYSLIIVDEFQDTSRDQWRVVRALAARSAVICLADPDQRIFEYLDGVDEHRLEDARQALSPVSFDLSGDNHRSPSGGLLDYANAVLRATPAAPSDNIANWTYRYADAELVAHEAVITLQRALAPRVSGMPTIAVLTRTNPLAARVSEALAQEQGRTGRSPLPVVEHMLVWDPTLTAMSALVVASILEWPLKEQNSAVVDTLNRIADFYRTKLGGGVQGARAVISKVETAIGAIEAGRAPRSKVGSALLQRITATLELTGDPVRDWQVARARLSGSAEVNEVFRQARLIRLLRSTDALGWALIDAWDGVHGYRDATDVVRVTLAEEAVNVTQQSPPAVSVMSMHKSKGKEFDGVVLVEGRHGRDPFFDQDPAQHAADRRLLRVAITRARHAVVFVRPLGALDLTSPAQ